MKDHTWKLTITHNEATYTFSWQKETYGDNSVWLPRVTAADGSKVSEDMNNLIRSTAGAYRRAQLIHEKKAKNVFDILNESRVKEDIMDLIERAEDGEYVGQYNYGMLYVQEAAAALDISEMYAHENVAKLIEEKRVGLSGNIFIPYEDYKNDLDELFEKTGHKQLFRTDVTWHCKACGKTGWNDWEETPADFPCVK